MVIGLPKICVSEKIYERCFASKQPRHIFNAHLPGRALGLLHLVHSDVCGPFEIPSLLKH